MKIKSKMCIVLMLILVLTVAIFNTKSYATDTDEAMPISENSEENQDTDAEEMSGQGMQILSEDDFKLNEGDLFVLFNEEGATDTTYVMDKFVEGNAYIIADSVKITGQINGALFVLAKNVEIAEGSDIVTHAYICAENITMSGFTTDLYAVTENFNFTNSGIINRYLKMATVSAKLFGTVGKDVNLTASDIDVYEDDENVFTCHGNFNYSSQSEISEIDKAKISGEVKYTEEKNAEPVAPSIGDYISDAAENVVFMVVIYALTIFLAPKFVEKSKEYASKRSLLAFGIGIAFTILLPIIAFILLFTMFGAGVALALVIAYFGIIMINSAIVTIVINEFVCTKVPECNEMGKKIAMIIPVSLVIYIIRQIPIIGGIASLIIFFVGVGITVLYQFDKREKKKEIVE